MISGLRMWTFYFLKGLSSPFSSSYTILQRNSLSESLSLAPNVLTLKIYNRTKCWLIYTYTITLCVSFYDIFKLLWLCYNIMWYNWYSWCQHVYQNTAFKNCCKQTLFVSETQLRQKIFWKNCLSHKFILLITF